ncbi:MAG TPA: iron-sulfur cluster assembly accessory protein [Actinomycetota bacterium]|nr:iron-sulfur cluster assembly accessory protein [Actinomycetota bacterium]
MSTSMETPVLTVTEPAARRVRAVAAREGRPGAFLRIRIVAGGCDGFEYEMGLEDAAAETDQVLDQFGLRVLVDPRSAPILQGSILEYHDVMLGGGLKVVNPQATHECTCGKSFAI